MIGEPDAFPRFSPGKRMSAEQYRAFHRGPVKGFVSGHLLSALGACHFDRCHRRGRGLRSALEKRFPRVLQTQFDDRVPVVKRSPAPVVLDVRRRRRHVRSRPHETPVAPRRARRGPFRERLRLDRNRRDPRPGSGHGGSRDRARADGQARSCRESRSRPRPLLRSRTPPVSTGNWAAR